MSNSYILKSRNVTMNKTNLINHLRAIRDKAVQNENSLVIDQNDVLDLIDFVQDIYSDRNAMLDYDFSKCEFFVDFPPNDRYKRHKCFYIRDLREIEETRQIAALSQNAFTPPTALENFCRLCDLLIANFKLEKRKAMAELQGKDFTLYDLYSTPSTNKIAKDFIAHKNLENDVADIVSENGLGNHLPYLKPEYEYLSSEFLDFYIRKYEIGEISFELKERRS